MIDLGGVAAAWRKSGPTFLRFCFVGAIGFAVDSGILLLLLETKINPIILRLFSFAAAVLVTFEFNRRWAFKTYRGSYVSQLISYVAVQAGGFLVNLSVFSLLFLLLPHPYNRPIVCIALASAAALLVNFTGLQLLVFQRSKTSQKPRSNF